MENILIVGASGGIGSAIVKTLMAKDRKIYGTYNSNRPDNFDPEIEFRPLNVLADQFDFDYLPESLEGLVYCPGSVVLKPFHRIKPETFVNDYQLQVLGAVKVVQALLPLLKKSKHASIVLFSTVAVQQGFNFHSLVSSSKGAVEGLSRALAAELAPKIRVNCIAPSITDTPLVENLLNSDAKKENNANRHPLKRYGQAEDIASMVEFLLSPKSSWITGQVLSVDGGMSRLRV